MVYFAVRNGLFYAAKWVESQCKTAHFVCSSVCDGNMSGFYCIFLLGI